MNKPNYNNSTMERQTKIAILWIAVMCGLVAHSLADLMPLFWSENIAIFQDGAAPKGLLMFMMTVTYLIPIIGILCTLFWNGKAGNLTNAILATLIMLFNIGHCVELLDFDPVQLPLLPVIMIISIILCVQCWKYTKPNHKASR